MTHDLTLFPPGLVPPNYVGLLVETTVPLITCLAEALPEVDRAFFLNPDYAVPKQSVQPWERFDRWEGPGRRYATVSTKYQSLGVLGNITEAVRPYVPGSMQFSVVLCQLLPDALLAREKLQWSDSLVLVTIHRERYAERRVRGEYERFDEHDTLLRGTLIDLFRAFGYTWVTTVQQGAYIDFTQPQPGIPDVMQWVKWPMHYMRFSPCKRRRRGSRKGRAFGVLRRQEGLYGPSLPPRAPEPYWYPLPLPLV